ncbi:MAG: histidine phosphatase family protein [Betaproteobacteria bacterium RIFCSPLOWO2_12_FULL_62_13]|nr:MAG: histidine phosphatase family protein [Betaproteobacteria bacterium RIFCSPLOWO2_12_FULL_62_13]
MDLILWRHADAESGMPDDERRLTAKGIKQAERMAGWLKERLPKDAVILASPARRTRETAQALTKKFEVIEEVGTAATPQALLKAAGWPHGAGTVVVVGHQPTLGQTAALALSGSAAEWSIKKGAIWWLVRRDPDTILRAVIAPDLL